MKRIKLAGISTIWPMKKPATNARFLYWSETMANPRELYPQYCKKLFNWPSSDIKETPNSLNNRTTTKLCDTRRKARKKFRLILFLHSHAATKGEKKYINETAILSKLLLRDRPRYWLWRMLLICIIEIFVCLMTTRPNRELIWRLYLNNKY